MRDGVVFENWKKSHLEFQSLSKSITLLSISDKFALCTANSHKSAKARCRSSTGGPEGGWPAIWPGAIWPWTTWCRNLVALSTPSSHTLLTFSVWKSEASGRACRASSDSDNNSEHKSWSSPDLQARLKKAKAKLRAALDPTRARPTAAFSPGDVAADLEHLELELEILCWVWDTGKSGIREVAQYEHWIT